MITYKTGDILDEEIEAIVNTVNCVGVMGRGIALQFRKTYPDNFTAYAAACKRNEVQPGKMFVFPLGQMVGVRFIINFPTKRHWKGKSRIEDIEDGLLDLVNVIQKHNIRSIAIPPLGCGLGGLDWNTVRPKIESAMQNVSNVQVVLFEPKGAPHPEMMKHVQSVPNMTQGRAALIDLMNRYLHGFLDPYITLLEVHKLMYFLQETGQPLKLRYTKAPYGPYAENLRHVFNEIEGHYISGFADGGENPDKQLTIIPSAVSDAAIFLENAIETKQRIDRVASLIGGFEDPFGLELLATVHWVMKYENANTLDTVVDLVRQWSPRKQQMFSDRHIDIAMNTLINKKWVEC